MVKIAIDGPAGAGKSSIARELARRLNIRYLDTGAMYRAIAYKTLQKGIATKDATAIAHMMQTTEIGISFSSEGEQQVCVDGEDVTALIRSGEVTLAASDVATLAPVREALVAYQRRLAEASDVVMDGRDIGSVVLPHADHKFFVTAAPAVRAQRRLQQLHGEGHYDEQELARVSAQIEERDRQDMTRAIVPLVQAPDALRIDTSHATLDESVQEILKLMAQAQGGQPPSTAAKPTPAAPPVAAPGQAKMGRGYRIVWSLARKLLGLLWGLKYRGQEHVNALEQGCIVVCNHISLKDPVMLAMAITRKVRFMAKEELFENRALGWLIGKLGAFPVHRQSSDTASIRTAMDSVKKGQALIMFAEGTRSKTGELMPFEEGVAFIAMSCKCPVVPAYISFRRVRGRRRVDFGAPIDVMALARQVGKAQRREVVSNTIHEAVRQLGEQQHAQ